MDIQLIDFFQAAVPSQGIRRTPERDYEFVKKTLAKGYIVDEQLMCDPSVAEYLDSLDINPNATFYETFDDVVSRSRFELFIDQIIHYASTYGTEYQEDTFILNDNFGKNINIDFDKIKVIKSVTKPEMVVMCLEALQTGIALKSKLVEALCEYIKHNTNSITPEAIDLIKNREAQAVLCQYFKIYPSKAADLLRVIYYNTTGSPMIIKNRMSFETLSRSGMKLDFLTPEQMVELSTIFYRFKPIFLALKHVYGNESIINKIRKLAKKNHKPLRKNYDLINNIFDPVIPIEMKKKVIENCTFFKKVTLLNAVRERIANAGCDTQHAYIVRNQKIFTKESVVKYNMHMYTTLKDILFEEIVNYLKDKRCVVKYPENYELAMPVSQKSFVGNLPLGTYYTLTNDNIIGCYWRNEWGTRDFDLSLVSSDGRHKYGWNAGYYDNSYNVVYSGDVTNADPEACELIYISKDAPNSMIYINRYNGQEGSKYKLFFAQEKITKMKKNYMVNPGNIQMQTMCTSDQQQQLVGLVADQKVYMLTLGAGNSRVSSTGTRQEEKFKALVNSVKNRVTIHELFEAAGFIDYNNLNDENKQFADEDPDIKILDLTNTSAGELINFLS